MEHPILSAIIRASFTPLGWSEISQHNFKFMILVGNAGPLMFRRFARERNSRSLDQWTKDTIDPLAADVGASALYPFDKPPQPFLTWARQCGAGHTSPLGLNIHPQYGLWHAYRAALLFPVAFDLPGNSKGAHPCESCAEKPCLSACPVSAFDGASYDVAVCASYLETDAGESCMKDGCKARCACPIGKAYEYVPPQKQFHMRAFLTARKEAN
jgi:hypothetical protein